MYESDNLSMLNTYIYGSAIYQTQLSLNIGMNEFNDLPHLAHMGTTKCWDQSYMDLVICHTHLSKAQPNAEPKHTKIFSF